NPRLTLSSSAVENCGVICGACARTSATRASRSRSAAGCPSSARSRSSRRVSGVIAGLPELGDGTMEACAGVGFGCPDDLGDLGVGEPGVELQGDELALGGIERGERGAHRLAARRGLNVVLDRWPFVSRFGVQGGTALAFAQFVERSVARDAEQPRPLRAAL